MRPDVGKLTKRVRVLGICWQKSNRNRFHRVRELAHISHGGQELVSEQNDDHTDGFEERKPGTEPGAHWERLGVALLV